MNPCPCGIDGVGGPVVHLPAGRPAAVPAAHLGAAARPDRPVDRRRPRAAGLVGGTDPAGVVGGRRDTDRGRPRSPAARPGASQRAAAGARAARACRLGAAERPGVVLAEREGLSGRGTERLLRVARTIADLDASDCVREAHLDEAARFRAPAEIPSLAEAG